MRKKFFVLVFILATAFISTTAFAYSIAHPQDGIYSIQPKCAPGKELSVQNHDRNWGANVIIDNINSGWQRWKIQRIAGTDFYSIIAVHSGLAVDVANATAQNGINIATWPYLGGSQNQFRIWDAGNNYFVIQGNLISNDSFVLDVVNAENRAGANVWSYGFNGSDAQLWRLEMTQSLSAFQPYNKTATKKVTAYAMPDLQATAGNEYVSAGDNVTVLREEGNAIFVRYPIRNGFGGNSDNIMTSSESWQYPVENKIISQQFGDYLNWMAKTGRPYHCGLDLVNNSSRNGGNPPIYAATSGIVKYKGYSNGNGNHIVIQVNLNGQTLYTSYSHLNSYDGCPAVGQSVSKGQKIGIMGATGNVSGKHLHFAVYNKYSADPFGYTAINNRNSVTHNGITYYNPEFILNNGRLP